MEKLVNGDLVAKPQEYTGAWASCALHSVDSSAYCSKSLRVPESLASQSRAPHKTSNHIGSYTRLFEMRHMPTVL